VNISCPINSLSYGIVSTSILKELDRLNEEYVLFPKNNIEDKFSYFKAKLPNYITQINLKAPSLNIWHEFDIFNHIGRGPRVAFPIFEKNQFNPQETWNIHHQDMVLVCSKWAAEVVRPVNQNVHVCPLGVDKDFFIPSQAPLNKVIFYTQGKREFRKGHDFLHKVFHKAFENNKNVELWMFTENVFDSEQEDRSFKQEYRQLLGNKVKFWPRLKKCDMIKFLSQTHCGIFLSRAEGWNLPALECMAMGKDIISTYYSGHTEFIPKEYCVKTDKFVEAKDSKWFNGGFTWMDIIDCEDEIVEKLRQTFERKIGNNVINKTNVSIANKFTWENTTREVLNGIRNSGIL
jgi:glycosyltransferase involved in cell wall biosynthesis